MEMEMQRTFVRSTTLESGNKKSAYKITCRSCGKSDKISVGSHSNSLPPEVTRKKFHQMGWLIGNRVTDDVCPSCQKARADAKAQKKIDSVVEFNKFVPPPINLGLLKIMEKMAENPNDMKLPAVDISPRPGEIRILDAVKAGWASHSTLHNYHSRGLIKIRRVTGKISYVQLEELKKAFGETPPGIRSHKSPEKAKEQSNEVESKEKIEMDFDPKQPPQMTKEDRRIIFSEIDSHYLDESRGYEKEWNDERVAKGLNVPLAWVRTIREDNFGPERGDNINAEILKLAAAKDKAEASSEMLRAIIREMASTMQSFVVKHENMKAELDAAIIAIRQANETINAHKANK